MKYRSIRDDITAIQYDGNNFEAIRKICPYCEEIKEDGPPAVAVKNYRGNHLISSIYVQKGEYLCQLSNGVFITFSEEQFNKLYEAHEKT